MLSILLSEIGALPHTDRHRGIIWENSRAFVPEWHRGPPNTSDSVNVTVWKHQSINKTLLCRSKGFQYSSKRQGDTTSKRKALSESERRKLPPLLCKGKESAERGCVCMSVCVCGGGGSGREEIINNVLPHIIKIEHAYNLLASGCGGGLGSSGGKRRYGSPHCCDDRYQTLGYCHS